MKRACFAALLIFLLSGVVFSASDKGVKRPAPVLVAESGPAYWGPAFSEVYEILFSNLREPDGLSPFRYALPSRIFLGIYLWDTAFIAQVWKPWDVGVAQDVNAAVMHHSDGGRLQHFVSRFDRSEWTQPAVMAWSVWEVYMWSGDLSYLERWYPVLKGYNRWLYENRRLPNGLFHWAHPYESGIDNSPRFSSRDESEVADMMNIAAVDLNSYVARQNLALSMMAGRLGREEEAGAFSRKHEELSALINGHLWDESTGLYYDLDLNAGELIKVKTIAGLFPLFGGAASPERAGALLDHIMNPDEFNTLIPLPSVARDDPAYEPDMWRGPVWINTAYMVIVGMEDYGFRREAALLSWKLADGVYSTWKNEGKIFEFYDPDRTDIEDLHRKRGNLYKKLTLGDKPRPNFVGWTGLANTLVTEHLLGLQKEGGALRLRPCFPEEAAGAVLKLSLPAEGVDMRVDVKGPDEIMFDVTTRAGRREFIMACGETREL